MQTLLAPLGSAALAILLTLLTILTLALQSTHPAALPSARLVDLVERLHAGALLYLRRLALPSLVVTAVIFVGLAILPTHGWQLAVSFWVGNLVVGLAAYGAVAVGARAQLAVVLAAESGMHAALRTTGIVGTLAGLLAGAAALGGLALLYFWLRLSGLEITVVVEILTAYAGGVALAGLFWRVGGGLFAKAADLGEALAGSEVTANLADNVGDLATDIAGAVAEAATAVTLAVMGAMWLIAGQLGNDQMAPLTETDVLLPLVAAALALPALTLASYVLRGARVKRALTLFVLLATLLTALGFWAASGWFAATPRLAGAAGVGLLTAALTFLATEFFAGEHGHGVANVLSASNYGFSFATTAGLTAGFRGAAVFALLAGGALFWAHALAGTVGLALVAVAVASLTPAATAGAAFGATADVADSLATLAAEHGGARAVTRQLDAAGNTAAAVAKSYTALAASLGTLVFFQILVTTIFAHNPSFTALNFDNPRFLAGVLLGVAITAGITARLFHSVSLLAIRCAHALHQKTALLDVIMQSAQAAFRQTLPLLPVAILIPLLVGYCAGVGGVLGFLLGVLTSSLLLALTFVLAGSAWDNAKLAKTNAITLAADQIGDTTKDAVEPGLIIFLQLTLLATVLAAPLLASWQGIF